MWSREPKFNLLGARTMTPIAQYDLIGRRVPDFMRSLFNGRREKLFWNSLARRPRCDCISNLVRLDLVAVDVFWFIPRNTRCSRWRIPGTIHNHQNTSENKTQI